jgi:hypothetical protein
MASEAKWLDKLERKMGWFALPGLAIFLSALQVFGFIVLLINPAILNRISLDPAAVLSGEVWRILTFLAIPLSDSPLFMFFAVWFLYFTVNILESHWGEFKTTFYVFISVLLTAAYSLVTGTEIYSFRYIEITILLATATLFPDLEILLLFFPVKLKFIGIFSGGLMLYNFFISPGLTKIYLVLVFANYILFFGGAFIGLIQQLYRKWDYQKKMRK